MIIADKPVGQGLVQLLHHISIKLILQLHNFLELRLVPLDKIEIQIHLVIIPTIQHDSFILIHDRLLINQFRYVPFDVNIELDY